MEIHTPHGPVNSWRDFLLHLATVTIGILIALSLEQGMEWFHHKAIVREARENITNELRDNQKRLDASLPGMDANLVNQEKALDVVKNFLAHKKLKDAQISIGFSSPNASSTSWRAAEAIGALSFMDYPSLKQYAEVYSVQNDFLTLSSRTQDVVIASLTYFHGEDFAHLSDRDLDEARRQLLASIGAARAHRQVAKQLSAEYSKVLDHTE